jgi:large subunit ribosomal protein L29
VSAVGQPMPAKKEIHQFHNLTDAEARQKEQEMAEELFRLRMRKSTGQLENPMHIRHLRRDLARLKTIQHTRVLRGTGE